MVALPFYKAASNAIIPLVKHLLIRYLYLIWALLIFRMVQHFEMKTETF